MTHYLKYQFLKEKLFHDPFNVVAIFYMYIYFVYS